jgi:hypothetical protein
LLSSILADLAARRDVGLPDQHRERVVRTQKSPVGIVRHHAPDDHVEGLGKQGMPQPLPERRFACLDDLSDLDGRLEHEFGAFAKDVGVMTRTEQAFCLVYIVDRRGKRTPVAG